MNKHIKYLWYVIRHKWFVFVECVKLGVPLWAAIIHDWQKFTPVEWRPYVLSFYGPWKYKDRPEWLVEEFNRAWLHHIHYGPHHWQYWVLDNKPLKIPDRYRREMLADLRGTGRVKVGYDDTLEYYTKNRDKIKLHPQTREWMEHKLGRMFFDEPKTSEEIDEEGI